MSGVCGHCIHYKKMPFAENICTETGKIVPFLAERECFVAKAEVINNQNKSIMAEVKTKVCKVCGRELPIDDFRPNHMSKDGHLDTCTECLKKKTSEAMKKRYALSSVPPELEDAEEKPTDILGMQFITDQKLVDELRARGYEVTCKKTIEL